MTERIGPTISTTGVGTVVSSTISYNGNEVVTGGGFLRSNTNVNILSSHKSGNGWTVTASAVLNVGNTFEAFAECLTVS